jgi:hypothetical protein
MGEPRSGVFAVFRGVGGVVARFAPRPSNQSGGIAVSHHVPELDPRSVLEDEGIPDLEEGVPGQQWAVDPQLAPVPGDNPTAVDEYGTTATEQVQGESLGRQLAREQPDPIMGEAYDVVPDPAARLQEETAVQPDLGIGKGPLSEAGESIVMDAPAGPVRTEDISSSADFGPGFRPGDDEGYGNPAQPEEPGGQLWEEPRPAGRLIAPDEGAHPDFEPDEVAQEAGPDFSGYSAEEAAMRVDPE